MRAVGRVFSSGKAQSLTGREREVLRYLVRGFSHAEVADSVGLPIEKVEHVFSQVCRKLHLERSAVREYAIAVGILGRDGIE